MKNSIHQKITDKIIFALEEGTPPWIRAWEGSGFGGGMPRNVTTKNEYNGINILLLWMASDERGFSQSGWLTFKQANEAGGNVRKGETGTKVVYFGEAPIKDRVEGEPETYKFLKSASVFNVSQCENLPDDFYMVEKERPQVERINSAERFIAKTGATITTGCPPCFNFNTDIIQIPPAESYKEIENFYSSNFHELGHWTGAKKRLDRPMTGLRGSKEYAQEELIAELTSAFLCGQFGLKAHLQHSSYLAHWLDILKEDNRAIFRAASQASKAARFLNECAYKKLAA